MAAEADVLAGGVSEPDVSVLARAKINLALHVTGRRGDGYHLLDSLVCFAEVGDVVRARRSEALSLAITGPMAAGLGSGPDNLVMRAAALMGVPVALELEKVLPLASGIGGGSADAAATLRALAALGGRLPGDASILALGADVPVCLAGQAARMQGIGERLTPVTLPQSWLVLVNPGFGVSTPDVFRALKRRENPPLPEIPAFADAAGLAVWLAEARNDLQAAAVSLRPEIAVPLSAIRATPGCLLARMSGSGATCFGLYAGQEAAEAAALGLARPGWWVKAAAMVSGRPAD